MYIFCTLYISYSFKFFFESLFIYFERDGQTDRQRQGGAESQACTVSAEPDAGLELTNREIKSQTTD